MLRPAVRAAATAAAASSGVRVARWLIDRMMSPGWMPLAAASLVGLTDAMTTPLALTSLSRSERAISGVSVWTVTPRLSRADFWLVDCCASAGSVTGVSSSIPLSRASSSSVGRSPIGDVDRLALAVADQSRSARASRPAVRETR